MQELSADNFNGRLRGHEYVTDSVLNTLQMNTPQTEFKGLPSKPVLPPGFLVLVNDPTINVVSKPET